MCSREKPPNLGLRPVKRAQTPQDGELPLFVRMRDFQYKRTSTRVTTRCDFVARVNFFIVSPRDVHTGVGTGHEQSSRLRQRCLTFSGLEQIYSCTITSPANNQSWRSAMVPFDSTLKPHTLLGLPLLWCRT